MMLMEIYAKLKYLRIAPRKVRLVADLIRGMPVKEAQLQLEHIGRRAAHPIAKLLKSAVANSEHNYQQESDNLYIKKITVDQGPMLKRYRARAMGRAAMIRKRTSHITVVLDTMDHKKKDSISKKK